MRSWDVPVHDIDLTTDAVPERVLELVDGWADAVWTIGIEFGTVGLRKGGRQVEITTYRSESYQVKSRKPEVSYGTSLEEDLVRRDFTVNAMAVRVPGGEFVDPFGGLGTCGPDAAHSRQTRRLLQRRPPADDACRPVRRPARVLRRPGGRCRDDRDGGTAATSSPLSGSATSSPS